MKRLTLALFCLLLVFSGCKKHGDVAETEDGVTVSRTVYRGHEVICAQGVGFSPNLECWMDEEPGKPRRTR